METISVDQADRDQLRDFAKDQLGINFPHNIGLDTMREKVRMAGCDMIDVVVEAGGDPDSEESSDLVQVTLQKATGKGGDRPVPVAVNGKLMLIPRGKPVRIPKKYLEVLQHARTTHYDQDEGGEIHARETHSYPFSTTATWG